MKKKYYDEEIDLADVIINLWNNKIKIIFITGAFIVLGYLYFHSFPRIPEWFLQR